MSVTGVFTKGRPVGHPNATSILRYIPRARVPWQPSRFARANLEASDVARLWGRGRYRAGPGSFNSGYSTEKTHVMEDATVTMIPKHELEKYMPDISIPGGKALVTPVSLMSARNGHRVTHDLLHSYDPHIGRLQKPARVDHDNISVEDPNRVGLHAATLDARGRIYRWLRRGPFFQEDHYFRRSFAGPQRSGALPPDAPHEGPLVQKMLRLAAAGKLKEACEAYRSLTSAPPVEVYRALTAACIPGAHLADAIAVMEDGYSRLFYIARDGEVLHNVMQCAVKAKHRVRVMWAFTMMCGRYYENVLVRAEVEPVWRFRIALLALQFLLDTSAGEEARTIYQYLVKEGLLDSDLSVRLGHAMAEALQQGKPLPSMPQLHAPPLHNFLSTLDVTAPTDDDAAAARQLAPSTIAAYESLALQQNARRVAPQVAQAVYQRYVEQLHGAAGLEEEEVRKQGGGADETGTSSQRVLQAQLWARFGVLGPPPSLSAPTEAIGDEEDKAKAAEVLAQRRSEAGQAALQWLEEAFPDVAVLSVLRHARYRHGHTVDLLLQQDTRAAYVDRAVQWLHLLSERAVMRADPPLPYLRKSRPSLTNTNVRVVYPQKLPGSPSLVAGTADALAGNVQRPTTGGLLAAEEGYEFAYRPGMRMVEESFAHDNRTDAAQSQFLALRPVQRDVSPSLHFLAAAAARSHSRHAHPLLSTGASSSALGAGNSGTWIPCSGTAEVEAGEEAGARLLHTSLWDSFKGLPSPGSSVLAGAAAAAAAAGGESDAGRASTLRGSTPSSAAPKNPELLF